MILSYAVHIRIKICYMRWWYPFPFQLSLSLTRQEPRRGRKERKIIPFLLSRKSCWFSGFQHNVPLTHPRNIHRNHCGIFFFAKDYDEDKKCWKFWLQKLKLLLLLSHWLLEICCHSNAHWGVIKFQRTSSATLLSAYSLLSLSCPFKSSLNMTLSHKKINLNFHFTDEVLIKPLLLIKLIDVNKNLFFALFTSCTHFCTLIIRNWKMRSNLRTWLEYISSVI